MLVGTYFYNLGLVTLLLLVARVSSFGTLKNQGQLRYGFSSRLGMFFADELAPEEKLNPTTTENTGSNEEVAAKENFPPLPVQLVISDSEGFLNAAGAFLVDSFWLGSDHHKLKKDVEMSTDARMNLIIEQAADLQEKYGERMGRRSAKACVVGALDEETKELVGLATLKETLMMNTEILEPEKAEAIAKNAVAALGPKQRREYKNAPIAKIAEELLSPDTKAVCVLSNLAVGKKARRRGVAQALCDELDALANDWNFDEIHLLVESENTAARTLYEKKLGYNLVSTNVAAAALRVDFETGAFVQIKQDTLVMAKQL
ncbi:unnamed protein product [Pseudo-nitzschia multistriata]|uniref:N-acetyltransferase domain-containing protein n=1 Tax=Pseudo-nitzschia multistriata TaxID=183589 RepID=A0A448ZEI0_9STRA|nr:unnamed protein product [Pseudo-nitzschia multistriata]